MRNEKEVLELIINIARKDDRVRAVILDGSRADPDVPCDAFQDFDVIYLVTDIDSFRRTPDWIDVFGMRMILQLPDDMCTAPPDHEGYAYLMQFMDGNRIDLTLYPVASYDNLGLDSIRRVLLDKDGIVKPDKISDDRAYLPSPPTPKEFEDCCNEFWWVCPYAAKGLWRGQITYAKTMLDEYVREQLMKMLRWYVGEKTNFKQNPGKEGKYFQKYLEPELWELLLKTYADAEEGNNWEALFVMCELFRKAAVPIAEHYHFTYPAEDDRKVFAYLQHIRDLPRTVKGIY